MFITKKHLHRRTFFAAMGVAMGLPVAAGIIDSSNGSPIATPMPRRTCGDEDASLL